MYKGTTNYSGGNTSDALIDINSMVTKAVVRKIPTLSLDQNIGFLQRQKQSIEHTIYRLECVKKERKRAQNHRDKMNELAALFYDTDALDMPKNTRIQIIMQRLGCDKSRANALVDMIEQWCIRKKREIRNEAICVEHSHGRPITALARQYGLSRQHIYNILDDSHKHSYLRHKK